MLNRGSKSCSLQSVGVQKNVCSDEPGMRGESHNHIYWLPDVARFCKFSDHRDVLCCSQELSADLHRLATQKSLSQMAKVPPHHFLARRATKRLEVVPAWDLHSIRTIRADLIKRNDSFAPCSHSYPILIILGFYLYFIRGVYFLRFFFSLLSLLFATFWS